VTIWFGANDAALLNRTSAAQHVPVAEYADNLRLLVRSLFAAVHNLNAATRLFSLFPLHRI
jgi:lysophospholipase L1-like esterase